jgi:hypothetical protein
MPNDPLKGSIPRRGLPGVSFAGSNDSVARIPVATIPLQTYGPPETTAHAQPDPRFNNNVPAPGPVADRDYDYAKIGAVGSPGSSTIAKNFGEPSDPRSVPRLGFTGRQEGPRSGIGLFRYAKVGQTSTLKPPPGENGPTGSGLADQQAGNDTYDPRLHPIRPDMKADPTRLTQLGTNMAQYGEPKPSPPSVADNTPGQIGFIPKRRSY